MSTASSGRPSAKKPSIEPLVLDHLMKDPHQRREVRRRWSSDARGDRSACGRARGRIRGRTPPATAPITAEHAFDRIQHALDAAEGQRRGDERHHLAIVAGRKPVREPHRIGDRVRGVEFVVKCVQRRPQNETRLIPDQPAHALPRAYLHPLVPFARTVPDVLHQHGAAGVASSASRSAASPPGARRISWRGRRWLLMIGLGSAHLVEQQRRASNSIIDVGNQASPQMVFFGVEYQASDLSSFVDPDRAALRLFLPGHRADDGGARPAAGPRARQTAQPPRGLHHRHPRQHRRHRRCSRRARSWSSRRHGGSPSWWRAWRISCARRIAGAAARWPSPSLLVVGAVGGAVVASAMPRDVVAVLPRRLSARAGADQRQPDRPPADAAAGRAVSRPMRCRTCSTATPAAIRSARS